MQVIGEGIHKTQGVVQSVSEQTEQVTIELDEITDGLLAPCYSNTIKVPLARVQPLRDQVRGKLSSYSYSFKIILFFTHFPKQIYCFFFLLCTFVIPFF